jgi:hypothetical protein
MNLNDTGTGVVFEGVPLHVVQSSPFPIVLGTPFLEQFDLAVHIGHRELVDQHGHAYALIRISDGHGAKAARPLHGYQTEYQHGLGSHLMNVKLTERTKNRRHIRPRRQ